MSTKCEYYVDMGEHNKPLCKKRNYRPSDCESCPTYIKRLQEENAKLRELVFDMLVDEELGHNDDGTFYDHVERANELGVRFDE